MKKQEHILYTTQEVADILKVHQRTIFRYIKSGKIKASKILGREWRIKKEDLDKLIK
ncbi:MAG: helix-turn-helix domain-containing protein [Patescibacteria group bacterium]